VAGLEEEKAGLGVQGRLLGGMQLGPRVRGPYL
jgi:hypothetical protein